jgi:hypothetical protein
MTVRLVGGPLDGRECEIDTLAPTITVPIAEVIGYEVVDGVPLPIFREERYRLVCWPMYEHLPA